MITAAYAEQKSLPTSLSGHRSLLHSQTTQESPLRYLHFMEKKTETQRDGFICQRLLS